MLSLFGYERLGSLAGLVQHQLGKKKKKIGVMLNVSERCVNFCLPPYVQIFYEKGITTYMYLSYGFEKLAIKTPKILIRMTAIQSQMYDRSNHRIFQRRIVLDTMRRGNLAQRRARLEQMWDTKFALAFSSHTGPSY